MRVRRTGPFGIWSRNRASIGAALGLIQPPATLRACDMDKNDQLKRIRYNGSAVIEQFLPAGARAELEDVIRSRRHEVDTNEFLMFMSIRALLREDGMQSCESNREAGEIMALLNV